MQVDRIKISQEVNYNGMPTWIGLEAIVLPDEDPKEGLRTLQTKITEYMQEEQKAYGQSKWAKSTPEYGSVQIDKPTMSKEEELIQAINGCVSLEGDNGLLSYRIPASLNPSTKAAYDLKLKLLKK